jgi:hypothetical protein
VDRPSGRTDDTGPQATLTARNSKQRKLISIQERSTSLVDNRKLSHNEVCFTSVESVKLATVGTQQARQDRQVDSGIGFVPITPSNTRMRADCLIGLSHARTLSFHQPVENDRRVIGSPVLITIDEVLFETTAPDCQAAWYGICPK